MPKLSGGSPLTRAQFAAAVRADEKWVENTSRALGHRLRYTHDEARYMGLVRLLASGFGIVVSRAGELASAALRYPPRTRSVTLETSDDGAAAVVIDLARYYSSFAAALSAAVTSGEGRRRGRPPAKSSRSRNALAVAESYGVDVSLLRATMAHSPAERLARLDANASFVSALRRR